MMGLPSSHPLYTALLSVPFFWSHWWFCEQVRTTAPEKYRVKPSNSSCEPGASVDIVVSLHGGEDHTDNLPFFAFILVTHKTLLVHVSLIKILLQMKLSIWEQLNVKFLPQNYSESLYTKLVTVQV